MYLSHPLHLSKCPVMSPFVLRSRYQALLSIATKDDISKIRDNDRIEDIIKRLRELAKNNDISPDIVEKLWRYIIELSIELETEIFSKK